MIYYDDQTIRIRDLEPTDPQKIADEEKAQGWVNASPPNMKRDSDIARKVNALHLQPTTKVRSQGILMSIPIPNGAHSAISDCLRSSTSVFFKSFSETASAASLWMSLNKSRQPMPTRYTSALVSTAATAVHSACMSSAAIFPMEAAYGTVLMFARHIKPVVMTTVLRCICPRNSDSLKGPNLMIRTFCINYDSCFLKWEHCFSGQNSV